MKNVKQNIRSGVMEVGRQSSKVYVSYTGVYRHIDVSERLHKHTLDKVKNILDHNVWWNIKSKVHDKLKRDN